MGTSLDLSLLTSMGQSQGLNRDSETIGNGLTQVLGREKSTLDLNSDQSGEAKQDQETSFHNTLDKKLKQDKTESKQEVTRSSQDENEPTEVNEEQDETSPVAELIPTTLPEITVPESITIAMPEGWGTLESLPEGTIPEAVVPTQLMEEAPLPQLRQALSDALAGQAETVSPEILKTDVPQTAALPTEGMLEQVGATLNESVSVNAEALTQAVAQAKPDTVNGSEVKSPLAETTPEVQTSAMTDSLIAKMEQTQESLDTTTANTLKSANTESGPTSQDTLSQLQDRIKAGQSEAPDLSDSRDNVQAPVAQVTTETIASTWSQGKSEMTLEASEISSSEIQPSVQPAILSEPTNPVETVPMDRMPEAPNPARSVSQQILESVQTSLQTEEKSIVINLTPPELGRVTIRFQEGADGLKGELELSRQEIRHDVERALPQIMQSLQNSGIQIRKMEVNVNVGDQQGSSPQQELFDQEARDSQQQNRWNQQDNIPGGQSAVSDGTSAQRSNQASGADASGYESSFDTDSIDMLV